MRLFTQLQIREAYEYAKQGGQALHVWKPFEGKAKGGVRNWPGAPAVFLQKSDEWGHLIDYDVKRLEETARMLGVRRIRIERRGSVGNPRHGQHIDLCGAPLVRAKAMCDNINQVMEINHGETK